MQRYPICTRFVRKSPSRNRTTRPIYDTVIQQAESYAALKIMLIDSVVIFQVISAL